MNCLGSSDTVWIRMRIAGHLVYGRSSTLRMSAGKTAASTWCLTLVKRIAILFVRSCWRKVTHPLPSRVKLTELALVCGQFKVPLRDLSSQSCGMSGEAKVPVEAELRTKPLFTDSSYCFQTKPKLTITFLGWLKI